jgi:hypothetical protein
VVRILVLSIAVPPWAGLAAENSLRRDGAAG